MIYSLDTNIDTIRLEQELRYNRINRDGWWRTPPTKRTALRTKLAGSLVGLADRLSPGIGTGGASFAGTAS